MASTMASSVSTLMEKSSRYITKKMPTSDTGMATTGMSVERQSRKNKKMMTTTSTKASMMVCSTSRMESRMNTELSMAGCSFRSAGRSLPYSFSRLLKASAMSIWFEPGCGITARATPGTPFTRKMVWSFSGYNSA